MEESEPPESVSVQIVALFKEKVSEAVTLLCDLDLHDDIRQEVWEYWQQVTTSFYRNIRKQPLDNTSNHDDDLVQTVFTVFEHLDYNVKSSADIQDVNPTGSPRGRRKGGKSTTVEKTCKTVETVDSASVKPTTTCTSIGNLASSYSLLLDQLQTSIHNFPCVDANASEPTCDQVPSSVEAPHKDSLTDTSNLVEAFDAQSELVEEITSLVSDTKNSECVKTRKYPKRRRTSARQESLYAYPELKSDEAGAEDAVGEVKKRNKENRKTRKKSNKNEDGSVTCEVCHIKLAQSCSLIAHMRQHTGVRPFVCSFCERTFTTKANMIRHEDSIHKGLKPFKCSQCPRSFGENKTLKSHMTTHSGEKPYICPVCSQGFAQKGTLKHHMYRHTNFKGHLCDLCGKSFRQKTNLQVHKRRHDNHRQFKCEVCQKLFYTKGDLNRHKTKHSKSRPYSCELCTSSFTRLQYLKEHQNFHRGVKPHKCQECPKSFYDWASLHRHKKYHNKSLQRQEITAVHASTKISVPQSLILTDSVLKYQIPVLNTQESTLLDAETHFGDVYQITYVDDGDITVGNTEVTTATISEITMATNAHMTGVTIADGINVGNITTATVAVIEDLADVEINESKIAAANITQSVQLTATKPDVDFSAINLLAHATTQHIYHDD